MKRSTLLVVASLAVCSLQARADNSAKAAAVADPPAPKAAAAGPIAAKHSSAPGSKVAQASPAPAQTTTDGKAIPALPTQIPITLASTGGPGPVPPAASGQPGASQPGGKWSETEESPALRVSRAWVKLGEAAEVERSDATHRLNAAWKREVAQSGAHSRTAQAAYAQFLSAYKADLDNARKIYEGVLREVDAMDDDGIGNPMPGSETSAGNLAHEAQEEIKAADRDDRLSNAACFLSPDTCTASDPADKALEEEISGLVKDTLEAGGPDGGLSLYSLRRKASLLALRARVMAAVTQRAAARLATEVATAQDGQGSPRALPSPIAPMSTAQRRTAAPMPSDPYR